MRLRSTSLSLRSSLSRFSKWGFASKVKQRSWAWWLMPKCLALRRLRQEDCEFETAQDYIARLS